MIKYFKALKSILGRSNKQDSIISEVADFTDRMFTSDEERKEHALLIEKVVQSSRSTFVQSGRSALMWAMAIIAIYHFVVRDALAAFFGVSLPPIDFDAESLLSDLLSLIAGTL